MVFTFRYTISSTTNREGCGCLVKGHPLALARRGDRITTARDGGVRPCGGL